MRGTCRPGSRSARPIHLWGNRKDKQLDYPSTKMAITLKL